MRTAQSDPDEVFFKFLLFFMGVRKTPMEIISIKTTIIIRGANTMIAGFIAIQLTKKEQDDGNVSAG